LTQRSFDLVRRGPDVSAAAKSGSPTMTNPKASVPASVPAPAGSTSGVSDVTVSPVNGPSALDTNPDARSKPPTETASAANGAKPQQDPQAAIDAKNNKKKKPAKKEKVKIPKGTSVTDQPTQPAAQPASTTPASTTPGTTPPSAPPSNQ